MERRTGLDRLKRKLRTVNREVDNVMSAIKAGVVTASTKDELLRLEAERERLRYEVDGIADADPDIVTELPNAMERYTVLVQNLEAAVAGDIPLARQQISALVGGRITLHPRDEGYLEAEVRGDYAGLVSLRQPRGPSPRAGAKSKLSLVAGAGSKLLVRTTLNQLRHVTVISG